MNDAIIKDRTELPATSPNSPKEQLLKVLSGQEAAKARKRAFESTRTWLNQYGEGEIDNVGHPERINLESGFNIQSVHGIFDTAVSANGGKGITEFTASLEMNNGQLVVTEPEKGFWGFIFKIDRSILSNEHLVGDSHTHPIPFPHSADDLRRARFGLYPLSMVVTEQGDIYLGIKDLNEKLTMKSLIKSLGQEIKNFRWDYFLTDLAAPVLALRRLFDGSGEAKNAVSGIREVAIKNCKKSCQDSNLGLYHGKIGDKFLTRIV